MEKGAPSGTSPEERVRRPEPALGLEELHRGDSDLAREVYLTAFLAALSACD